MMKLNMLLASMTFVSLVGLSAHAQDADTSTGTGANEDAGSAVQVVPNLPPPPTRIEAAQQRKGSVVVKGYSEIGVVQGQSGSAIRVLAVEVSDTTRGAKEYGVAIAVDRASGQFTREVVSYLDYEEIDSLLGAIDALARLDNSATTLMNFDAIYRTHGDVELTSFTPTNGARGVALRCTQTIRPSGNIAWSTAYFTLSQLGDIRQQLIAAKLVLDKAKAAPSAASK